MDEVTISVPVREAAPPVVIVPEVETLEITIPLRLIAQKVIEITVPLRTVPPEEYVPPTPAEIGMREMPWYTAWLKPVVNYLGVMGEAVTNYFGALFSHFIPVGDFFADPIGKLKGKLDPMFKDVVKGSVDSSLQTVKDVTGSTPEWKKELDGTLQPYAEDIINKMLKDLSPDEIGESPLSPKKASIAATGIAGTVVGGSIALWLAHSAAEAATLGQYEAVRDLNSMVLAKLGLGALSAKALSIPLEHLVFKRSNQFYASLFTPEIPTYTDLINMVVKEKITIEEFKTLMKYQGYSEEFSQLIWDSHFIAPSLGQLLTSWRRGHITTEELDQLEILVDLDPIYKNIWKDQRYSDPTPRQGRFMYEAGAIDEARLKNIVERSGLLPDDVEPFTEYLVRFQEREWKRRYLTTMATGYREGVFTEDELTSEILDAGYNKEVAGWIVKTEDIRKKIEAAKPVKEKAAALLTQSIVKDAYLAGEIDEDYLREYFTKKGYSAIDVTLAVNSLVRDKEEMEAKEVS